MNQPQFQAADLDQMTSKNPNLKEDVIIGSRTFHYSIEQNTPEWDAIRHGKITASPSSVLLTDAFTKTGKPTAGSIGTLGKGAVSYAKKLALNRYDPNAGVGEDRYYGEDMERGHNDEEGAAIEFERITGLKTESVGFVSMNKNLGVSPDSLIVDSDFGIEMKSAKSSIHWDRILNPEAFKKEHFAQCQFSMMVTGRKKWFLTSYNPTFTKDKLLIVEINRDEDIIQRFVSQIKEMERYISHLLQRMEDRRK